MRNKSIAILVTGVLLGFLVVLQARSFNDVQGLTQRDTRANIFRELQILKTTNENLSDEISDLSNQLQKASNQEQAIKGIEDEIQKDRLIAGQVDIAGNGIEVTIKQNVPVLWMTDMINELWTAGAEAISVNNIRLINSTVGFDTLPGGQISLNGVVLTAPYTFDAIGDKKTLLPSLDQPQGIVQRLKEAIPGVDIATEAKDRIVMKSAF